MHSCVTGMSASRDSALSAAVILSCGACELFAMSSNDASTSAPTGRSGPSDEGSAMARVSTTALAHTQAVTVKACDGKRLGAEALSRRRRL
eukprot:3567616-Prymnesium_polylepis.1